jgi:hypothetical protein
MPYLGHLIGIASSWWDIRAPIQSLSEAFVSGKCYLSHNGMTRCSSNGTEKKRNETKESTESLLTKQLPYFMTLYRQPSMIRIIQLANKGLSPQAFHTERGKAIRVISARPATKQERKRDEE